MKNALDYGFRPGESPRKNAIALQEALSGGGEVAVTVPGIYDLDRTVVIESRTRLTFSEGVSLRRNASPEGYGYVLVNKGAFDHATDEDITIEGMTLICNGQDYESGCPMEIDGMNGHLSFLCVKSLTIRDFTCLDLCEGGYCIHICTFENVLAENLHIEGMKDGIHFGRGKNFTVRHSRFRTFDDPIALNAYDYATGNPQVGWIENGLIEDCYDLDDQSTTGFFCRLLAGAWVDWYEGMEVQHSDTVVSHGRVYRVMAEPDGTKYRSLTPPTHEKGSAIHEGIRWVMAQEDVQYDCGCRNIHFKDIHLLKHRPMAFGLHLEQDCWCRSIYPGARMPVQEDLTFENIVVENQIDIMLWGLSAAQNVTFRNIRDMKPSAYQILSPGRGDVSYPRLDLHFENVTFSEAQAGSVVCAADRGTEIFLKDCRGGAFALDGDAIVIYE